MKADLQSELERCDDEEKRRDLERRIRECDEAIERWKRQPEAMTAADDHSYQKGIKTLIIISHNY